MPATSSSTFLSANDTITLTARVIYDPYDKIGVTIIVTCAALSLACVIFLLAMMALSFWRKKSAGNKHFFVRSHAAPYFTCLLISDLIQLIGSLMSARWLSENGIIFGSFCSIQGAIKNAGNLGISLWTLVLAMHTFCVLFLRWNPRDWALYATLLGVWFLIGFLVVLGPGAIQQASTKGPYYSIAGLWCWIADPYPMAQVFMEYFWMFLSAGISFILYSLVFLRLRGNLYVASGRPKFRMVDSSNSWKYLSGRDIVDIELTKVARGMLGFPIVFTIVVLPIAVCRLIGGSGVPLEATTFADSLFNLTGVFDLILFMTTRSLLPEDGFFANSRVTPRPKVAPSVMSNQGIQPYPVSDFSSPSGFAEMYQKEAEQSLRVVPPRTQASLNPSSRSISPDLPEIRLPSLLNTEKAQYDYTLRVDANAEGSATPTAWDDVDLGRQLEPREDNFGSDSLSRPSIDKRYTAFTISAYAGGEPEESSKSGYDMESYPGPITGSRSGVYDEEQALGATPRRSSSNSRI